jgi:hypothetical protein
LDYFTLRTTHHEFAHCCVSTVPPRWFGLFTLPSALNT